MRIRKKTLYIVLSFSIVVVLLLFHFVFLMGWFGNPPKLNRYDSLIETCEVERDIFKVLIRCDVFINETSQRDGKNCLGLTVANKDSTNILPLEVCEKEKILDTSNPLLNTDMKVPMHMVFKYTYLPPISHGISNISMELMEDREISDVLYGLYKNEIEIFNVRTEEMNNIRKKGYYVEESEKFIEGMKIGVITFTETKINKIITIGSEIVLDLIITINGVMRSTEVTISHFEYLKMKLPSEQVEITSKNISEVDISKFYNLIFVYIPKGSNINEESLNKYCNESEVVWNAVCDRKKELENYNLDKSIDEYIKDSFERLIIYGLVENG